MYVNETLSPSRHIELAQYADDTAIIGPSRQSALLVSYLELYLSDVERWVGKWRIAIDVWKNTAMILVKADRRIPTPRPFHFFGEPIHWDDAAHYLGVTLDPRLNRSTYIAQG